MMANPLAGKPLRYLIGANGYKSQEGEVVVVGYDATHLRGCGIGVKYCNLYAVAKPSHPEWVRALNEQLARAHRQHFQYVELDNADSYQTPVIVEAVNRAAKFGLRVIAKNPLLINDALEPYISHPNVFGAIVEQGCGDAAAMDDLRQRSGKPDLPVWFVCYGSGGEEWGKRIADGAIHYRNMGITHSDGEYQNSHDIVVPNYK